MQQKASNPWRSQRLYIVLLVLMLLLITITVYLTQRWKHKIEDEYRTTGLGYLRFPASSEFTFQFHLKENLV